MTHHALPKELRVLIERVAAHPHGLGFLRQAYLESVAVTLGVHPFAVEAAREWIGCTDGREQMIEEVKRAKERLHEAEQASAFCTVERPEDNGLLPDVAALIQAAIQSPQGVRSLIDGEAGTVAAEFGVHPYLVFRARTILRPDAGGGATGRPAGV